MYYFLLDSFAQEMVHAGELSADLEASKSFFKKKKTEIGGSICKHYEILQNGLLNAQSIN